MMEWNSCNLNNNFKSFITHHVFQPNKQHTTKNLQGMYYTIGSTPWDKTEIIYHALEAQKMQTFLAIKLTPQV